MRMLDMAVTHNTRPDNACQAVGRRVWPLLAVATLSLTPVSRGHAAKRHKIWGLNRNMQVKPALYRQPNGRGFGEYLGGFGRPLLELAEKLKRGDRVLDSGSGFGLALLDRAGDMVEARGQARMVRPASTGARTVPLPFTVKRLYAELEGSGTRQTRLVCSSCSSVTLDASRVGAA